MSVRSLCVCLVWAVAIGCSGLAVVNSETSIDDPKTVKECRVHIEKALEEYWDKAEPNADDKRSNRQLHSNPSPESNLENPCVGDTNCDQTDVSESKTEETQSEQTESTAEIDDGNDADDDDDDDIDETTEDDDEDEKTTEDDDEEDDNEDEAREADQQVDESATATDVEKEEESHAQSKHVEDDVKPVQQQETRRVYVVKNLNKEPIEFNDLTSDKVTKKADDEEDDDDDDDDDDESDDAPEEETEDDNEDQKSDGDKGLKEQETAKSEEKEVPKVPEPDESPRINILPDQSGTTSDKSKVLEEKGTPKAEIKSTVVAPTAEKPQTLKPEIPEAPKITQIETPQVSTKSETAPQPSAKDDLIENIYEEEDDDDDDEGLSYRSRAHIDAILGLDEVGTELEKEEDKLAQGVFKDIKKIELSHIRPMELLYKYADSTTRALGDAEIFNRPMILFLGPWNSGKTSIINYILGIERTPSALETGTGITDVDFTVITHGPQRRVISGTELVTDWRYAGVQRFGQGFLDHLRSIHIPHALLQKVTIIDTPGILENRKSSSERGYSLHDAFQWFADRADAVYVVLDPNKVDIGAELAQVIDRLKGREVRFVLNKADSIRRSDLMRVVGQLFWNLSPLMSGSEAPVIYAVSLTTHPYHPSAPTRFLDDQEKNLFHDMRTTLDNRVENRILYARKHAVRVRNHAKMVDCYLATFYRHKSIFSNKRNVAKQIIDNPTEYSIYDGVGGTTNVSRYDIPSPAAYKDFFRQHALYDFKPLASTCSYFRGCPMDKLDEAIVKEIPEMMARFKKAKIAMQDAGTDGRKP